MKLNMGGTILDLDSKGKFRLAIAYLNTKGQIRLDAGDDVGAKKYFDKAFEVEVAFRKFAVDNSENYF